MSEKFEEPVKFRLHRFEWKEKEAEHAEIPFSSLRDLNGNYEGAKYLLNLPDLREDEEKNDFFQKLYAQFDPRDNVIERLILKIAIKAGLTQQRLDALRLFFMGKNKRDITKILHPERMGDLEDVKTSVGIEVYTQRMLNHFIPKLVREYSERHYPFLFFRFAGVYPIHEYFLKKALIKALQTPGDVFAEFFELYRKNPISFFELKKIVKQYKRNIKVVDGSYYVKTENLTQITKYCLDYLVYEFRCDLDFVFYAFSFDGNVCNSALILFYNYLAAKMEKINENNDKIINYFYDIVDDDPSINFDIALSVLQEKNPSIDVIEYLYGVIGDYMQKEHINKQSIVLWNRFYYKQNHHREISKSRSKKISVGVSKFFVDIKERTDRYTEQVIQHLVSDINPEDFAISILLIQNEKEIPNRLSSLIKFRQEYAFNKKVQPFCRNVKKKLNDWLKKYGSGS